MLDLNQNNDKNRDLMEACMDGFILELIVWNAEEIPSLKSLEDKQTPCLIKTKKNQYFCYVESDNGERQLRGPFERTHHFDSIDFTETSPYITENKYEAVFKFLTTEGGHTYIAEKLDFEKIKQLIENKAEINQKNSQGSTPFHYLCLNENVTVEMVKFFIEKGADLTIKSKYGNLPLHSACANPKLKDIKIIALLMKNIDVNTPNNDGLTPLHFASMKSTELGIIEFLLQNGADLAKKEKTASVPMHLACLNQNANVEFIQCLVESSLKQNIGLNIKDERGETLLHFACINSKTKLEIIKYLIEKGVDLNAQNDTGGTPLFNACLNANISFEMIKCLVENKADLTIKDKQSNTFLHHICNNRNANLEILQYVTEIALKNNIELNTHNNKGFAPFHVACLNPNIKFENIKCLVENGIDLKKTDKYGNFPLHLLFLNPNVNLEVIQFVIEKSLEQGLNLNVENTNGATPLQLACINPNINIDIIKCLIENKADVNIINSKTGGTAVGFVRSNENQNKEIIDYLLEQSTILHNNPTLVLFEILRGKHISLEEIKDLVEKGADLKMTDNNGNTMFHYVCGNSNCNLDIIKYFVTQDAADLTKTDNNGNTAFHMLCNNKNSNLESIQYVIEIGKNCIDLNLKNTLELTPLHMACKNAKSNLSIIKCLVDNKADVDIRNSKSNEGAVDYATINNNREIIEFLTEQSKVLNNLNNINTNMLFTLMKNPNASLEEIKSLVKKGADLKMSGEGGLNILHLACMNQSMDIVKYLVVANDLDPATEDNKGSSALHFSCKSEKPNLEAVKLLFEKVNDTKFLNLKGAAERTALHLACVNPAINVELIKFLINKGSDLSMVDSYGFIPLHLICGNPNAHLEIVEFVFNNTPEGMRNRVDGRGFSALYHACLNPKISMPVREFLIKNYDLKLKDPLESTILHAVCSVPHTNITLIKCLVENKADLNSKNAQGNTPLHSAIMGESVTPMF